MYLFLEQMINFVGLSGAYESKYLTSKGDCSFFSNRYGSHFQWISCSVTEIVSNTGGKTTPERAGSWNRFQPALPNVLAGIIFGIILNYTLCAIWKHPILGVTGSYEKLKLYTVLSA